jgi:DNA repair protein RadC
MNISIPTAMPAPGEQPDSRGLHQSVHLLSDSALLAVVSGRFNAATERRARQWLEQAGGLANLIAADRDMLRQLLGFGRARQDRLLACVELGRRCLERSLPARQPLRNPEDAAACFSARLADLPHEAFACVFLDTRHRVICFELLFRGTIDGAPIYPREVLKRALHHNAAAVIAGHNHPSGDCEPSQADRTITRRLQKSLELIDIRLLDHLIVARGCSRSLARLGWL